MVDDSRIKEIDELILEGNKVIESSGIDINKDPSGRVWDIPFDIWVARTAQFFIDNTDKQNAFSMMFFENVANEKNSRIIYPSSFHVSLGINILRAIRKYFIDHPDYSKTANLDAIDQIKMICNSFHLIARQLRTRRKGRAVFDVTDEYDVQDLIYALLWIFFKDIIPEEVSPYFAGASSRIDFLLKDEEIAIETKMTRSNEDNADDRIGRELLLDIDRYKEHPHCKTLICFVYDPNGRIANPERLTKDLLSKNTSKLQVDVYIRPMGY